MRSGCNSNSINSVVDTLYRSDYGRILATLIHLLGDFDLAEEALQEAFTIALERWSQDGVPANPRSWIVSTGRFKGIDILRRQAKTSPLDDTLNHMVSKQYDSDEQDCIQDDILRLIFTCCHPALSFEGSVALTLREVCGLSTEEIARAFLTPATTVAQRIVRTKAKIKQLNIPFQVPYAEELNERLNVVLRVIYLVFNEGYTYSSSPNQSPTLSLEAIRLGRLLAEILPEAEVLGLLALMLLQESRRKARYTTVGDTVLLEHQDRTLWDAAFIAEGTVLAERAISSKGFGSYTLQAAIAAVHANSSCYDTTDWEEVIALYGLLLQMDPSPVIELNLAAAVAMKEGPLAGLAIIDRILNRGELTEYYLAYSARAELYRRSGNIAMAKSEYRRALHLSTQLSQQRFLTQKIAELDDF